MRPHTDIVDNGTDILVLINMPGVPLCSISVQQDGSEVTIHGCSCCDTKAEGSTATMVNMEFVDVEYCLTLELSPELDDSSIRASLSNGVLALHLPRRPRVKRQIPVEQD